jgi:NADP-dependent 3-hydroxy acid dehydrogenase YdfG
MFDNNGYEYECASRETGWSLDRQEDQARLAHHFVLNGFNVFINNSAMWKFHQIMIAENMYNAAKLAGINAQFIHMGSTADTGVKGRTWRYPTEKKALRDYNRDLTYMTMGGSNIKTTLLSPGSLTTPSVMEKHPDRQLIDVEYIADIILWLLSQPEYVNINEISLDPVQSGAYARER